jgi:DNA-directed RNA polymerase specialized sigma24 family protein
VVKALVSAAAVTSVIRAQADRVHDAARRLGCTDPEATAVTAVAVTALLDDLDKRPGTVRDLAGGLFARAWEPALQTRSASTITVRTSAPPADAPDSVLQTAAQSVAVQRALGSLPDDQRFALLVRDSYGLDLDQTAVALDLDPPEAARVIALGRLGLTAAFDNEQAISLAGHDVAVGDLGQLSDGSAPPGGRFASLRRHVSGCALCASVLFAQSRAREMLSAFPVLALPEQERVTLLREAEQRTAILLPTAEEVRRRLEEGSSRRPLVSPVLIAGLLVVAVLVGLGIGALISSGGSGDSTKSALEVTATPTTAVVRTSGAPTPTQASTQVVASRSSSAPASSESTHPSATVTSTSKHTPTPTIAVPPPTAKPTKKPTTRPTTSTSSPALVPVLSVSPTSATYGSTAQVSGSNFPSAASVVVTYLDASGDPSGMPVTVTASKTGTFTASVPVSDGTSSTSNDGPHTFVATATVGGHTYTAQASFTQVPAT